MLEEIKQRIETIKAGKVPDGYKKTMFGVFPSDWIIDKRLGDIGVFGKGKGIPGDKLGNGNIPCVGYGDIYMKFTNCHFEKVQSFVDIETSKESTPISKGTLLFTGTGETAEEIGKCVCYNGNDIIYAGGDIITFNSKIVNPTFLAYQQYQDFSLKMKSRFGQGYSVVHIQAGNLEKLPVAYPIMEQEQNKIVEILSKWDKAVELQEKLIEKLELQKKALMQKLLVPKKNWAYFSFYDIGELYQPETISDTQLCDKGYKVYGANGVIGYYSTYNHEESQIAITCRGSTCGNVVYTEPYSWITGNAMVLKTNAKYDRKFIYYLCNLYPFRKVISGSGQPQITRASLGNKKICLPVHIDEQINIRKQLDLIFQYMDKQILKRKKLKQQQRALQQLLLTGIVRV